MSSCHGFTVVQHLELFFVWLFVNAVLQTLQKID